MNQATLASFNDFYAELNPEDLARVFENTAAPQLEDLLTRLQHGQLQVHETMEQLLQQLPGIVLNLSAVMSIHLLQSYHNWLAEKSQTE